MPKAFLFSAASIAFAVPTLKKRLSLWRCGPLGGCSSDWQNTVFASLVGASMVAAFSFRAHSGGWENVLLAWLPYASAAFAVVATRLEGWASETRLTHLVSLALLGALGLQVLGAMFDPLQLSPNAADYAERTRLIALVRQLEKEGPVLVTTSGKVSTKTSFHAAALWDVLRAGDRAPLDLLEAISHQSYSAIFVGARDALDCEGATCEELEMLIVRHYFISARRHERERTGMTGYDARPRWLLRPRKRPLPPMKKSDLSIRQELERGLAEMKAAEVETDREVTPSDEIESLGDREWSLIHPSH